MSIPHSLRKSPKRNPIILPEIRAKIISITFIIYLRNTNFVRIYECVWNRFRIFVCFSYFVVIIQAIIIINILKYWNFCYNIKMNNFLSETKSFLEKIDKLRDRVLFIFIKPYWPRQILPNHLTIIRILIGIYLFILLFTTTIIIRFS